LIVVDVFGRSQDERHVIWPGSQVSHGDPVELHFVGFAIDLITIEAGIQDSAAESMWVVVRLGLANQHPAGCVASLDLGNRERLTHGDLLSSRELATSIIPPLARARQLDPPLCRGVVWLE
jgi:hypothetical protein